MEEVLFCNVVVYLNDDSKCIKNSKLNEVEIKALSISKTIYCNNRYYNINGISFNIENNTLEIFVEE